MSGSHLELLKMAATLYKEFDMKDIFEVYKAATLYKEFDMKDIFEVF